MKHTMQIWDALVSAYGGRVDCHGEFGKWMKQFVAFTTREGGDWVNSMPAHTSSTRHVHSMKTGDGRVWDVVNGWRPSTPALKVGDRVRVTTKRHGEDQFRNTGVVVDTAWSIVLPILVKFDAGANWPENSYDATDLEVIPVKPTLADAINKFKPSTRRILAHLEKKGSITVLEALVAYGTPRIAPAIFDLRRGGYDIETVEKKDPAGHNYTRYVIKKAA